MRIISEGHSRYLVGLLIFIIIMVALTVFREGGLISLYRLSKKLDSIASHNTSLVKQNNKLREEIRKLKEDNRYIEKIARKELGMIGRNEIVFQFEE